MRYLTAIILTLLITLAPSCKHTKTEASLRALQDSVRVADSIRNVQKKLIDIENARLDSIRSAEELRKAFENKSRYNIIVGSFLTPEYAKSLADSYRKEGYTPQIIKMEDTKFELVSAEAHENIIKAISRLRQFQDTVVFDAWMYIRQ